MKISKSREARKKQGVGADDGEGDVPGDDGSARGSDGNDSEADLGVIADVARGADAEAVAVPDASQQGLSQSFPVTFPSPLVLLLSLLR